MPCRILIIDFYPVVNGTASFVMGVYRHLDRSRFQFDFLISESYRHRTLHIDEIKRLGGRIFYFDYNRENLYGERIDRLRDFLSAHPEICGVHVHDTRWQTDPLLLADELRLPIKAIHSHTSWGRSNPLKHLSRPEINERINSIAGPQFLRLACSDLAGMYAYSNLPFEVIPNGIDTKKFVFNPLYRDLTRSKLGISSETCVVGFVANNSVNKNIPKALEVFGEFHKLMPNSILLMIGGEYSKGSIPRLLNSASFKDSIIHINAPSAVDMLYSAIDLAINTSTNEGLPFTIVEAQATGLPCLISDEITDMVRLTNLVEFMSIKKPAVEWAEKMLRMLEAHPDRRSGTEEIKQAGFDIRQVADRLMDLYQEQIDKQMV